MNRKLMLCILLLSSGAILAQNYHGIRLNASQELIDNDADTNIPSEAFEQGAPINIITLFQPEYRPVMANEDLTNLTWGTTVVGDKVPCTNKKCVDYAASIDACNTNLLAGKMNGLVVGPTMGSDGLMYLTVPTECYIDGEKKAYNEGGDFLIRIDLGTGSTKTRLGDAENFRVDDITGVYMTVSAPTYVTVTANFAQANTTTTFKSSAGGPDSDELGCLQRHAVFEMPAVSIANTPCDLRMEGKAKSFYNLFTYKRNSTGDPYGFPLKYVEIVFHGLKAGDKVGWTNYQSLHDGYIPVAYNNQSSIEEIAVDNDESEVYYNLQGIRVINPNSGCYIRKKGQTVTKVRIK